MRALLRLLLISIAVSLAPGAVMAQDPKVLELEAAAKAATPAPAGRTNGAEPVMVVNDATTAQADRLTHEFRLEREKNKLYEAAFVSVLAVVMLFIVLRFLSVRGPAATPHMVNATGLICIVFGTILLVLMAESETQLTASVGILAPSRATSSGRCTKKSNPSQSQPPTMRAHCPDQGPDVAETARGPRASDARLPRQ